MPYVT